MNRLVGAVFLHQRHKPKDFVKDNSISIHAWNLLETEGYVKREL